MLTELLADRIQIIEQADDWQDAILQSARYLLADGSIEERYVDAMINMCRDYHAYIVLADRFAMPHAASHCGVNKMGAALTIVKKPVDFFGRPVQVLLTLAPADSDSYLLLLQEVSHALGDPQIIGQLIAAKDSSGAADLLAEKMKQYKEPLS